MCVCVCVSRRAGLSRPKVALLLNGECREMCVPCVVNEFGADMLIQELVSGLRVLPPWPALVTGQGTSVLKPSYMVFVPPTLVLFSFCMSHSSCAVVAPTDAPPFNDGAGAPDTNPRPGAEPAAEASKFDDTDACSVMLVAPREWPVRTSLGGGDMPSINFR